MNILDLLVGKPIRTTDERAEQIGPTEGIPIFGLDGLSSAAYGPEAALSLLIPLGLASLHYLIPISAAIITLLIIVYFSYRQTIAAYPSGGGSYTVARFNLGLSAGLLAAAELLADYIPWNLGGSRRESWKTPPIAGFPYAPRGIISGRISQASRRLQVDSEPSDTRVEIRSKKPLGLAGGLRLRHGRNSTAAN
jgi:hypothetical protein